VSYLIKWVDVPFHIGNSGKGRSGQPTAIKHGMLSVREGMAWHAVSFTAYVVCAANVDSLTMGRCVCVCVCEQHTPCA